jgi:hypothetical protein
VLPARSACWRSLGTGEHSSQTGALRKFTQPEQLVAHTSISNTPCVFMHLPHSRTAVGTCGGAACAQPGSVLAVPQRTVRTMSGHMQRSHQAQQQAITTHNVLPAWCCRCSDVTDLIKATPEPDILRRDINDRPPIL